MTTAAELPVVLSVTGSVLTPCPTVSLAGIAVLVRPWPQPRRGGWVSNVELFQRIAVLYDNTVPFISWYFLILVLYLNMQLSFVLYVRGRGCKMHFFFFYFSL